MFKFAKRFHSLHRSKKITLNRRKRRFVALVEQLEDRRLLASLLYQSVAADRAESFLEQQAAISTKANAETPTFDYVFSRNVAGGSVERFQQLLDGVPIYGADIAVLVSGDAAPKITAGTLKTAYSLESSKANMTADSATSKAYAAWQVSGPLNYSSTELVVYANNDQAKLAYQVSFVPSTGDIGDFEVIVDAQSGDILQSKNLTNNATGTGFVFNPDPLTTAQATYGAGGFTDNDDGDTSQLNDQRQNVSLLDITLNGATHSLVGPYAEIVDSEAPFKGLFSQASSAFNFVRSEDGFEAVNTYYHIDRYMRYLNETLGLNVKPFQYSGGVKFDPSGVDGDDNSHYIGSTGELAFGEGGVDDAEDADVIIHELGHGIHDWITGGNLSQTDGLSEGVGDYFAQSYSRAYGLLPSSDPAYQYVFSWDGHNEFWNGRITNYTELYPSGLTGSIHTDGQIWSTANMKIWDAIGQEKTDRMMIEGLSRTGGSTSQQEAAQALLDSAIALGYAAVEIDAIVRIYTLTGYSVTGPAADDHGNGPGTATTVNIPSATPGIVDYVNDLDYFKFQAIANAEYRWNTNLVSLVDSTLELYDTDGTTSLKFDDDGGDGLASLITWTAPSSGVYYLKVQGFNNNVGTYELIGKVTSALSIKNFGANITYTENGGWVAISSGLSISAPGITSFGGGEFTATLTSRAASTDRLSIVPNDNVFVSGSEVAYRGVKIGFVSGGSGADPLQITFSANATPSRVRAVLRAVSFSQTSQDPSALARTIVFELNDGASGFADPVTKRVSVVPVNDKPVISNFGPTVIYRENARPTKISTTALVRDPDSANFSRGRLTIEITTNGSSNDSLEIVPDSTITLDGSNVLYNGIKIGSVLGGNDLSPMVVSLTTAATPIRVQALLRTIGFSVGSHNPGSATRTVSASLQDGDGGTSRNVTKSIRVIPTNDDPRLSGISGVIRYTNNVATGVAFASRATVVDVDRTDFDGGRLTIHVASGAMAANRVTLATNSDYSFVGSTIRRGGVVVGSFRSSVQDVLIATFNSKMTGQNVQDFIRALRFKTVNNSNTANRVLEMRLTDGDGGRSETNTVTIDIV